jgi:hypothetical protein
MKYESDGDERDYLEGFHTFEERQCVAGCMAYKATFPATVATQSTTLTSMAIRQTAAAPSLG